MKFRKSHIKELSEDTGISISKKSDVEQKDNMIYVDKIPYFFIYGGKKVPTLHCLKNNDVLPYIRIDDGAVKFLIKGADMMRPGIIEFQEFSKEEIICVKGPNSDIPISVGIALYDSTEAKNMSTGKVYKNLHYSGDAIWNTTLH